jgi:hypothetical protein
VSFVYARRVKAIVVLSMMLVVACKESQPATPAGASGSQAAAGSGSSKSPVIVVPQPKGPTLPKSKGKLDKATVDKLATLTFESFTQDIRRQSEQGFEVKQKTKPRPHLTVTVTVTPCFDCIPMELDKWKAKGEALKMLLAPELKTRPDTKFEVGDTSVLGQKMIYTYQLAYFSGKDENNNPEFAYSDAYALYYNDGINHIRVVAEYADDPVSNAKAMEDIAPKELLERMAKAFMIAYVQAWG